MSKADSIKDIRFKLRKLCDITDELVENLAKLHDSVHNGSFISEALNQKMRQAVSAASASCRQRSSRNILPLR